MSWNGPFQTTDLICPRCGKVRSNDRANVLNADGSWNVLVHGATEYPCDECKAAPVNDRAIAELAERFRVRLGLAPWEEHRARALVDFDRVAGSGDVPRVPRGLERRTGRTTKGILRALALCVIEGRNSLRVDASTSAAIDDCIRCGNDASCRLALGVSVRGPQRGRPVEYRDHSIDDAPRSWSRSHLGPWRDK